MASASPNPIVGLLIPLILIIVVIWSIRRSAKKIPVFHPCPICNENIRFSLGLQAGSRGHFKAVHSDYWKWLRKWMAINTIMALTCVLLIFPLLIYNIIPSRTATVYTGVGISIWAALTFSALAGGILHQYRGRRRFKEEWFQKHRPYHPTYGNLRGIEVQIKEAPDKARSAIAFLLDPIMAVPLHLTTVFINRKAGRARLDKYEDGRLWVYNGFGQLVAMDVKNPEPKMVDEQRLRIALKKGQVELRSENSADIGLIISILSKAQTSRTVDPSLRSL
jgi:hypothetical protein